MDDTFLIPTDRGRLFARHWYGERNDETLAPVVLFHDSLGCVALWRDFPAQLATATRRRVIAYDRLGFGQSDAYPGILDGQFMAQEAQYALPALARHLGFSRFVAFGHSVGGAMATHCAGAFPDQCEALITESTQAFVEDRTVVGILSAKTSFAKDGQLARLAKYHGDKAGWVLHAWIDTWLAPSFASWQLDPALALVQCHMLAIHGDEDEFGTTRHAERISTQSAGPSTVWLIPGCGHVPHREMPWQIASAVARFLDRTSAAA
ncbi:alpha/beta fold hydrolase [Tahibacter amnicola]|uniref:Alpha/beta hydrolase n=1 Tax=Tahibacter amnicola TaxID=2976241 RepID=A0ABY6BBA5_9GAMM|nr:alpha/beta hydrolase [Tahibacter amnicola]UXI66817.1 alpha/beta hydrolase [Tahibacter amnicola]